MHSMSVCTPARAAIMTGRLGLRTGVVVNFVQQSLAGLPTTELTMAEMLVRANYSTAAIGKWHLGHNPPHHPTYRGFESYLGVPYSLDMGCVNCPNENRPPELPCPYDPHAQTAEPALPLYNSTGPRCSGRPCNADIVAQPAVLQTLASFYGDAATRFIEEHAGGPKPFFLYMPFSHVHVPLAHDPRWTHKSARNTTFGDTLLELDDTIGRVLDALDAAGVTNDTLVVLTGDNGPWAVKCGLSGSQGPFTGAYQAQLGGGSTGKFTTWEGGHRVPGVAAWPGHIPAGVVSAALVSTMDLVPTFAALAGATLPSDRHFDGVDIADVLFQNATPSDRILFHPCCSGPHSGDLDAVRLGRYKAFFATYSVPACSEPAAGRREHNPPLIFDLETDPGETTPLAQPPSGLVQAMVAARLARLADIAGSFRSMANYSVGGVDAWPCCKQGNVGCRCND
eukprot:m.25635 g.25635  ORF g.25635 m.25635 type:complete len:452 (+) comp4191_c0_seq1:2-1357(+)